MADRQSRQLQRQAAQGDLDAEVAWYRERIRIKERGPLRCPRCEGTGLGPQPTCSEGAPIPLDRLPCRTCQGTGFALFEEAAKLAAYCGDEASRRTLGECPACRALDPICAHGLDVTRVNTDGYGLSCFACSMSWKRAGGWRTP